MDEFKDRYAFINEDQRVNNQRIQRHQMKEGEYQKILKDIPDEQENAAELTVFQEEPENRDS